MSTITPEVAKKISDRPYPETVKALAEKWGPIFGIPPGWIRSHAFVESSNRPLAYNERGNAYGLMQLKPGTAEDAVRWLKAAGLSKDPRVKEVLKKSWRGQPEDLLNPEVNAMLGGFYLGYIAKMFNTTDHDLVAAAYNQGPGSVRKALKSAEKRGLEGPDYTAAHKEYIAKIQSAEQQGYA